MKRNTIVPGWCPPSIRRVPLNRREENRRELKLVNTPAAVSPAASFKQPKSKQRKAWDHNRDEVIASVEQLKRRSF